MVAGEYNPLIDYARLGPDAQLSIPTPDHYLPMLYVLGSRQQGEVSLSDRRRRRRVHIDADGAGRIGGKSRCAADHIFVAVADV